MKGTLYPGILAAKSLKLTSSLVRVDKSEVVAGELGLFSRTQLQKNQFLGFYTSWIGEYYNGTYDIALFDDRHGMVVGRAIINGFSENSALFPLARANEYIWDNERNNIIIKTGGMIYVRGDRDICPGEELFIATDGRRVQLV